MKDVTIIIPNFNGAGDIDECLDALENQTCPADVIIVDDGSRDESAGVVEAYQAWLRNDAGATNAIRTLTLLRHTENKGFAAAVNTGIRAAKTPYVILLNNDAFAEETFTEMLVRAIKRRKKAFAVQAMMLKMPEEDGGSGSADPGRTTEIDRIDSAGDYFCALGWAFSPGRDRASFLYDRPARVTSACAGAAIYDRGMLVETGLFDEAHFCYIEDVDIGLRAFRAGYNSYFEPEAVVYHKGSATSGSRYNEFKTRMTTANSLYTAYKNLPAWALVIFMPFLTAGALIKGVFYAKKGFGRAWLSGLAEGLRKITAYRKAGKPLAVASSARRDALLFMELLGNCVRRVKQ